MAYKTIKEIALELNLTDRTIAKRFENLGIKGKKRIKIHYYTPMEVHRISYKKHINPNYPILSRSYLYTNQISIIEMYLKDKNMSFNEISRQLSVSVSTTSRTIKLYNERNCLIIQSRL